MHRDPPLFDRKRAKKSGRRSSWQLDPSESMSVLAIITGILCNVNLKAWLIAVRNTPKCAEMVWEKRTPYRVMW